jgi:four helix bundle protein
MKCKNLDVWKKSAALSSEIYLELASLKDYGFKDQITRSSLSIPSNIAEGMEKNSKKEQSRFLEIAKGSSAELITQIYIGIEISYIEKQIGLSWKKEIEEILKMIVGLQQKINS